MPCVLVARKSDVVDSVYVNNELASKQATQYLLEKNHKDIAIVVTMQKNMSMEDRIAGYKAALEEKNIPFQQDLIFEVEDDLMTEGAKIVSQMMSRQTPPTAVFCPAGDMASIGIIKELRHRGKLVPQDVAVLGYDDIPAAEVVEPSLTTVRQPKLEMGDYAINMIIDKIEGREKGIKHKELNAKLIIRESA
jgi:DNA-binding LacI/PurR family transcriptional regulator